MTRRQAILSALVAPFGFKAAAEAIAKVEPVAPAFNALEPVKCVVPNPAYAEAAYEWCAVGNIEAMLYRNACAPFEHENGCRKQPYPVRWNEWDESGKPISIPPFILEEKA